MKQSISVICLLLCFNLCYSQRLKTPTLSPFSKISQQVGLTDITLEYSRPSAKGRVVFGALVPYNKVWRTGANAATKLHLKKLLKLEGKQFNLENMLFIPFPAKIFGL